MISRYHFNLSKHLFFLTILYAMVWMGCEAHKLSLNSNVASDATEQEIRELAGFLFGAKTQRGDVCGFRWGASFEMCPRMAGLNPSGNPTDGFPAEAVKEHNMVVDVFNDELIAGRLDARRMKPVTSANFAGAANHNIFMEYRFNTLDVTSAVANASYTASLTVEAKPWLIRNARLVFLAGIDSANCDELTEAQFLELARLMKPQVDAYVAFENAYFQLQQDTCPGKAWAPFVGECGPVNDAADE